MQHQERTHSVLGSNITFMLLAGLFNTGSVLNNKFEYSKNEDYNNIMYGCMLTSMATIILKYGMDCYVYRSEERLHNQYNALTELRKTAIEFDQVLGKHPQLADAFNQQIQNNLGDDNITPLTERTCAEICTGIAYNLNNFVSSGAWLVSSSTALTSTFEGTNLENTGALQANAINVVTSNSWTNQEAMRVYTPLMFVLSIVASSIFTTVPIIDEFKRVSRQESIDAVNQLEKELGVNSTDVNAIAQVTATLKDYINILARSNALDMSTFEQQLANLEDGKSNEPNDLESNSQPKNIIRIQPTEYKSDAVLTATSKMLFDQAYIPKKLVVKKHTQDIKCKEKIQEILKSKKDNKEKPEKSNNFSRNNNDAGVCRCKNQSSQQPQLQ